MAVSSPYAVFRAADVCWPLALPPAWHVNRSLAVVGRSEARTGAGRRARELGLRGITMVQGELFDPDAKGLPQGESGSVYHPSSPLGGRAMGR